MEGIRGGFDQRVVVDPTEPSPQTTDKPPTDPTAATPDIANAGDDGDINLIQADLVQEPQVKQAQVVEGSILTPQCRRRLILLGGASIVAIVLAATLGVTLSNRGDDKSIVVTEAPTVSMAPTQTMAPTLNPSASPSYSPGVPLTTTQELYQAVDAYLLDPTPNSNVSMTYGYPIGRWNVGAITDMTSLFAARGHEGPGRNILASSFNEPIGNWDVSRVTTMQEMFYGTTNNNFFVNN